MSEQPYFPGWDLALEGAARAAEHADSCQPDWSEVAFRLLAEYARTVAPTFLTEDVRHYAHIQCGLPVPPDGRAWGAVIVRARKAGLLERVGYEPMKSKNCHSDPKPRWRWVG